MIAYLKVNAIIGCIVFLITGLFSLVNNTWQLSLFRAGIGFLLFFILGNLLSILLHQILSKNNTNSSQIQNVNEESNLRTEVKQLVEDIPLDEPSFQAIPLQSLHNGEEARN